MSASRAWLRIARRELAGGLGGFWIYLACLALGAWAIAAAGSITASFSSGLGVQSRVLLGGDAAINVSQREATEAELKWMEERSTGMSQASAVDLMGRNGSAVRQIDVRGVDANFPLLGSFGFNAGAPLLGDILARREGVWGIAASETVLTQLGVAIGDRFMLGEFEVEVRAQLLREPDRIGEPGVFQPRVIIAHDALREAGQLAPGRLFRTTYRLVLKPQYAATFEKDLNAAW
jgi:putative ABC transport system permease protein